MQTMLGISPQALRGMFDLMNQGFGKTPGPNIGGGHPLAKLMSQFDAIFTLNQDLFLETRYRPESGGKFDDWRLPGTIPIDPTKTKLSDPRIADHPDNFNIPKPNYQPYFKLHGSSAFRTGGESEDALLIVGGEKLASIEGSELLKWYRQEFIRRLAIQDTRLLIIGYSFGDSHINELLRHAASAETGLKVFIFDTAGVDVLYHRPTSKSSNPPSRAGDKLLKEFSPAVIGASRRPLESLFRHELPDEIERAKLFRFLGL